MTLASQASRWMVAALIGVSASVNPAAETRSARAS